MNRIVGSLAALLALSSAATAGQAAGLSIARFGGEHGYPTTTDATAIYYNPAGIAGSEGGHFFADMGIAWRHATYERTAATSPVPAGAEGANTGKATLFNILGEPFGGVTYRIGDLAVGAAYSIPFGGQQSWNTNDRFQGNTRFPGAVDGVQRWYTIEGTLHSVFYSLAAAYRLGPFAVGLSGNLIQTVVDNVQARETTGGDDVRNEGRAWIDAQSWDLGAGIGATYDASRRLRFGASYQTRPGLGGGVRARGQLHTAFAGSTSVEDVDFTTDLPDVVRAGAVYRPSGRWEIRLAGDYQRWSVLEHQCLMKAGSTCRLNPDGSAQPGSIVILNYARNWNDTWGIRTGASYWLGPEVELMSGVGYWTQAIPDKTLEPGILDFDLVTATVGAGLGLGRGSRLVTSYTQVFYLSRDTTGKSIYPTLAPPSRSPDSGGKYALQVGYLDLHLDLRF